MNIFSKIWNWITDLFYSIVSWAVMLLPESPFQKWAEGFNENSPFRNILNYINYFVPVGPMVTFFVTYLTAVAIWYVVRWALRLARYIQ